MVEHVREAVENNNTGVESLGRVAFNLSVVELFIMLV